MKGHLKSIELINIQSWGDNPKIKIDFDSDKLNVIKGRNETGKSVMFKVFRQMCFSNFLGKNGRRTLISRGKDRGLAIISLADGTVIRFEIYPTYQIYRMSELDKDEVSWKQETLPEEIRSKLGWYVDVENNILLNLIDTEMSMPLVSSSANFNANVLKFIVEDADLERSILNYTDWLGRIENILSIEEDTINTYQIKNSTLRYVDVDKMEDKLRRCKEIEVSLEGLEKINNELHNMNTVIRPTFNYCEEERVESILSIVSLLDTVDKELNNVLNMEKPKVKVIEEDKIENIIKVREDAALVMNYLTFIFNHTNKLEREVDKVNTLTKNVAELEEVLGICYTCGKPFKEDKCHE